MPSTGKETGLGTGLPAGEERRLRRQIRIGRWLSPLWLPLAVGAMRWGLGWRVENARELRDAYRRLRAESAAPVLICANHLTLVDSFLVAWAVGSPGFYLRHFDALPWNLPEHANFATSLWSRVGVYLMKSVPIRRGAARAEVAATLERFAWLLRRGEAGLIFPEGGRSRSGRVEPESAAYGVGRVVKAVPECRVLCVYLRGDRQESWSAFPAWGERFTGSLATLEPKSDRSGLRGSLEIARQIVTKLADLERSHLIGNDVVDLRDGDALPGTRHPRFDARVFAPVERAALGSTGEPDRLRWIFWAAKEAAYKVARKRDPKCVFSPVRFVVKLAGSSGGVVEFGAMEFPVRVTDSESVVHAVATDAVVPAARLCAGLRELSAESLLDVGAPGRAARELAVSHVQNRCEEPGTVAVARNGRVPVLEVDGVLAAADLSLSHHGRWVAFACELPEAGKLSA